MVSKKSLMSSENTNMSSSAGCSTTCAMAIVPVAGSVWNGAANALKSRPKFHELGICVTPSGIPTMVATMMEMSSAPLHVQRPAGSRRAGWR